VSDFTNLQQLLGEPSPLHPEQEHQFIVRCLRNPVLRQRFKKSSNSIISWAKKRYAMKFRNAKGVPQIAYATPELSTEIAGLLTGSTFGEGIAQSPSPSIPNVLYHILVIGQSNGTGTYLSGSFYKTVVSPSPLSANVKMFQTTPGYRCGINPIQGNVGVSDPPLTSIRQLFEEDTDGVHGESIASGMGNMIQQLAGPKNLLISSSAIDGENYTNLKQGTVPYTNCKTQATAGKTIATALGMNYQVLAICCPHGEADQVNVFNNTYTANLETWFANLNTDLKAISGQSGTIPFFLCQQNGYQPWAAHNHAADAYLYSTAYQALNAVLATPGMYIVGPRYPYQYNTDGLHLSPWCYRWHGEQYAKPIANVCFGVNNWLGFTPASLSYDDPSTTITQQYNVPVSPIVIDRTLVLTQPNLGYTYADDQGVVTVQSVTLGGDGTSAKIKLSGSVAANTTRRLLLGHGSAGTGGGNIVASGRTNLRDSDATVSPSGFPLYNWAPHHCTLF
jgi:hypothetical protein